MQKSECYGLGKLRSVRSAELELMRTWRNHPGVRENMYTRHEISAEEHLAWWSRIQERGDQRYFIYECNEEPLGVVSLNGVNFVNKNTSWAFYASPDAPRGTGSRMEYLALEYVFGELKLHKLCCEVLAFNKAVVRLHEKFGFRIEGVMRDQHMTDAGYVDIIKLGILKNEWAAIRGDMLARLSSHSQ